jgi:NitT/TauT family transport system permease protein
VGVRAHLAPLLVALLALCGWWALAAPLPVALLPTPLEVLVGGWGQRGLLAAGLLQTALAAVGGLGIALGAALVLGAGFLRWPWLERALLPHALLIQTLPIAAIAPLLVVWLGYNLRVALLTGAIAAFFPLLTSVSAGLRSADPSQRELLRLSGASFWQELRYLRAPAALPYLCTGLRSAGGLAVIGAIVGEFVGANGSPPCLGFVVLRAARAADTGLSFAAIGMAAALALLLYGLAALAERLSIGRWHPGGSA